MKLAISSYALGRWRRANGKTLQDSFQWIANTGVKAVEISGWHESIHKDLTDPVEHARRVRKECEDLGLKIIGYCVPADLMKPEKEQRKIVEVLKREVDAAAALGVKNMRHDVTKGFPEDWKGKQSFSEALKVVVPPIQEVAKHAEQYGITTSLENHGRYMQSAKRVVKLIETVDRPNYRLTLDMGNFIVVNDDPVEAVRLCAPYAVLVHAKDFHLRPFKTMPPSGWMPTTPPTNAIRGAIIGHGVLDVPKQLKLLKKAGYKGYLSIEFEGMEDAAMAVTLGLEYVKKHLEAIDALN